MVTKRNPSQSFADRCLLPHMVENAPKFCALPEGRVESQWKVSSPSLELTAASFSKVSRVFFQNPPSDFPLRKKLEHVPTRLFWTT